MLSGFAADRRNGRNLPFVAGHLVLGPVGFLLLSQSELPLLVIGALVTFTFGWSWPGLLMFAVVRVGRDRPAAASSAVQAGGFFGGAVGPVLFGLLLSATSYPIAWLSLNPPVGWLVERRVNREMPSWSGKMRLVESQFFTIQGASRR